MTAPPGTSSTVSDTRGGDARSAGPEPVLVLALECDSPLSPSIRFPLRAFQEVRVGRGERGFSAERAGLSVRVPDGRMSSSHARLARELGRWVVEDEGSKNGVWVNGAAQERALLSTGDLIELGHTFFLFVEQEGEGLPEAPLSAGELSPLAPGLETFVPSLAARLGTLAAVARSQVSVVLQGESGTGKELAARAVHALSGRAGPLVAITCGALPEALVESELFGHRRGAFTGAAEDRPGLVRSASGGTLFLDEVGDLPLPLQAAFLRVLQEGEVLPVGASQPVRVDLRVVAATHRDLEALVARGAFRADLFARLSGLALTLPPLRQRREDLGLLVSGLLRRAGAGASKVSFSAGAARALLSYAWPLNVRELEKSLGVALALAGGGRIERHLLPEAIRGDLPAPAAQPIRADDPARRDQLLGLLERHRGNVSAIARELGLARMQIQRWLKRYGLDAERFRSA